MTTLFHSLISHSLNIPAGQVERTIGLLNEGATIPFISRYRKEVTGGLDEVQIGNIKDQLDKLTELKKRKDTILSSIEEQGKLTSELKKRIEDSWDSTEIEDLYLPYKPKRVTKAEIARKKGLEPLAKIIMIQNEPDLLARVKSFIKGEVKNAAEALQGARDIIAEWVNENEGARNAVRNSFAHTGIISSKVIKGKEEEGAKYRDYFDFSEPLNRCSSHRLLALRRGEAEGILRVSISPRPFEKTVREREQRSFRPGSQCGRRLFQTSAKAFHRNGICQSEQNESRRRGHPCFCRELAAAFTGTAVRTKASVRCRPRISYRMQISLPGCPG